MAERTYSQQEIARILDAASKRQAEAQGRGGEGLTLAELEEVAAASGIAPEHVAAAAAALAGAPVARDHFLGMPVEVEGSRLLPGEVSEETWAKMVGELRRAFGGPGIVSGEGRMRSWSTATGRRWSPVVATVEPEDGRTRLTLSQSTRNGVTRMSIPVAIWTAFALVFAVIAAATAEANLLVACLFFGLLAAFVHGGTQVGTRAWARRRTRQFEAVADRLELVARNASAGPVSEAASAPEAPVAAPVRPALSLDETAAAPDDETARTFRRTRS